MSKSVPFERIKYNETLYAWYPTELERPKIDPKTIYINLGIRPQSSYVKFEGRILLYLFSNLTSNFDSHFSLDFKKKTLKNYKRIARKVSKRNQLYQVNNE